ncbi:fused MFS/spermidine synthase, partial [candidate division KSB1 bacterium]|nr:fused MFS/spermidine synthase [candidate division KSB1 bacterium]
MARIVIFIAFFLSGVTGLLYEIVWVRIFGLIFGNTTLALSAVMGLAGGGLMLGKIADRHEHPLKLYAWLEAGAGLCALLIPLLRAPMESLFAFLYPQAASQATLFFLLKFLVAFLLMFPATFLMGGTLPVLSRAVVRESERTGFGIGTLYGVNTLGAMAGCFVTGFVLIRVIGVANAIYAGVLTNFIIAAGAYLLWRFSVASRTAPALARAAEEAPLDQRVKIVLAAVALVLVFVMTNSVYATTVMLTTMLCGIGVGSFVAARRVDRARNLFAVFGWIEIGIGCSALLAAIVLINLSWIHDRIFTIGPRTSWWTWNGVRFFEAFLVMFLPALLMGASFPVAGKIAAPRLQNLSSRLGLVYFCNTLGGVAGSFLTSFILISALGTSATVTAMVLLNLLLGVFLIQYERRHLSRRFVAGFAVVGMLILTLGIRATPATLFTVAYSHVEKDFPLIDYREGIEGTVTVHEQVKPFSRTKRIDVDGLNVAGTSFMLKTLQTLQGHIPLCLHPNPQSALQIGFGTGETSKCALRHPLADFQVAEISQDVLELSDVHFRELNEGVLKHPKFDYAIVDGKNIVKYAGQRYDVVMNDGNYAVATSSASLFTKDHFENCRDRLQPGGIVS